ncbi:MAG TPA: efflux RND transporter permease subunit [Steroidobacteraceae bacterium]|nr:efflux RND transporter permease subunit [Steroidobacteraceae bacterium]
MSDLHHEPPEGFNLSTWALGHRSFVVLLLILVSVFGIFAYGHLAQSEDPPFTFKVMVIRTFWPGATAPQVQEELTDRIARTLQATPHVDFLNSYSRPGESTIFFTIQDSAPAAEVPETWYQVRKRVGDIAYTLPAGIQGPYFDDEFGDVYTNIYALEGDGFTPAQLHDWGEWLRSQLLRVPQVNKVDFFADQEQRIYVEIPNATLSKLGLTPQAIAAALGTQNAVTGSGVFTTGDDRVFVRPSGQYHDVGQIANTLLRVNGRDLRLGDIAHVAHGYVDPPAEYMRFDHANALGLGVTMASDGDVIELGKALDARVKELQRALPAGLAIKQVSSMPKAVARSVDDFVEAVAEAIGIVLLVSLVSLGFRTGMVVVISIPLVLAGTALAMNLAHIGLHKVSLGTLILALGLLVDDAIIAVESMAVKLEQGFDRLKAAAFAYAHTAFPMLSGTLVTVAGFLPTALARSSTGEYTRSIFQVSAIALLLSWLTAVAVIPMLGYKLLPAPRQHTGHDVYGTAFYRRFRALVTWCVDHRWTVIGGTVSAFVLALAAFSLVPRQFFPSSDRPELIVDLRLPQNASFAATLREAQRLEHDLDGRREIDHYVDFVGAGAPRFFLPLDEQLAAPNFAQFIVTAKGVREREALASSLDQLMRTRYANLRTRISRLENGPPVGFPVQFRVSGPRIATVRQIADELASRMRGDVDTTNVQLDWDEPAERSVHFEVDQAQARRMGVTSEDVQNFLQTTLSGYTLANLRRQDLLIPIELRSPPADRADPAALEHYALPAGDGRAIPLSALGHFRYDLEYGVIWERDREPTITVESDVRGNAQGLDVTQRIDASLKQMRAGLPAGYHIDIGGSVEENAKAQNSIVEQLPLLAIVVLVILMIQLQSFSRVFMVVLTAPLGLIGVVLALLLFGKPFGFVAMLGTIAMFGIIMRNSVILVDQIEQDVRIGHSHLQAIVGATVRRFRPITVTAAAAVLALIPLLSSNFFGPMATALMGGITVATVLTLFFLPALYAAWFRVRHEEPARDIPPQSLPALEGQS